MYPALHGLPMFIDILPSHDLALSRSDKDGFTGDLNPRTSAIRGDRLSVRLPTPDTPGENLNSMEDLLPFFLCLKRDGGPSCSSSKPCGSYGCFLHFIICLLLLPPDEGVYSTGVACYCYRGCGRHRRCHRRPLRVVTPPTTPLSLDNAST